MHDHQEEVDLAAALRPKADRAGDEAMDQIGRAGAGGRVDVLGPAGLLGLQRAVGNAGVASLVEEERSPVLDVVGSGGGRPLEPEHRADMEAQLGHDFGDVRVHTGAAAHESAGSVHAQAYTVGSDIVFADGKYDPGSPQGRHMLAHELTHVVQQRAGAVEGADAGGGVRVSDPSDRFEREASATADQVGAQPPVQREAADEEELEDDEDVVSRSVQRQEEDEEDEEYELT